MLYIILYDLLAIVVILTSLVAFLITFNTTFPEGRKLIFKGKFRSLKCQFEEKPIRGCLTAISFLIFFGMGTSYLIPVEIDVSFLIRTALLRIPTTLASLVILWTVIHIQHGDWDINRRYPKD